MRKLVPVLLSFLFALILVPASLPLLLPTPVMLLVPVLLPSLDAWPLVSASLVLLAAVALLLAPASLVVLLAAVALLLVWLCRLSSWRRWCCTSRSCCRLVVRLADAAIWPRCGMRTISVRPSRGLPLKLGRGPRR